MLNRGMLSSNSDEWYTPPDIMEKVVKVLGHIDIDPCSNPAKTVPADTHYTIQDDGLTRPWTGKLYVAPPYKLIKPWIDKIDREYRKGTVTEALVLVPSRTDTKWWNILGDYPVCFLRGRLHFSGSKGGAPFPSAMIYLGTNLEAFEEQFSSIGLIYVAKV